MSIKITPDSKPLRNYRILFAFCGLILVIIFGPSMFGFDSLFTLPLFLKGLSPMFLGVGAGLLLFKSIFFINIPVILIDEFEIRSKHSYWTQSYAWKKLNQVSLDNNRIELTYKESGRTDSIKLPFLLYPRSPEIRDALREMCS